MRAVLMALFPLLLWGQEPDEIAQQRLNSPTVAAGKAQFQQICGFCHGPDGRGASGPDLIRSSIVSHDVNGNLIGEVVRNGRPEKGMPAIQLSDTDIRNIAEFLHAQSEVAGYVARRIPIEYPLEKLLVGNAEDGKTYFNGAGKCVSCHSATGDLAHIATKYKPFDLQTRIAFPSGAKPTVTVTETSGKTFRGEQVYSDEFSVTVREKNGWTHTWKRNAAKIEVQDPLVAHERLLQAYTDQNIHDLFAYLETLK